MFYNTNIQQTTCFPIPTGSIVNAADCLRHAIRRRLHRIYDYRGGRKTYIRKVGMT